MDLIRKLLGSLLPKRRRRNVEFRQVRGRTVPIRHSEGYDPHKAGEKAKYAPRWTYSGRHKKSLVPPKTAVGGARPVAMKKAKKAPKKIPLGYYDRAEARTGLQNRRYIAAQYAKGKWAVYERGIGFVRGTQGVSRTWAQRDADSYERSR